MVEEENKENVNIYSLSMNFLLDCAFGRHDDLVTDVIDKAYVDMAAHTLKGFGDDYMKKWKCRYNATEVIVNGIKSYVSSERDFNAWHRCKKDNERE